MKELERTWAEVFLNYIIHTSENEAEEYIRDKVIKFYNEEHTDAEVYDFLVEISKIQCDRAVINGQKVCVGYISGFTQSLCAVDKSYLRPKEGITTKVDREALNKHFIEKGLKLRI